MFTSWSEQSTPAELSMASVLMRPPASAYSIRARCVNPRLPPSATTRQRSSAASTRTASLVRSPTSAFDSVRRLHERADAAVPEQVDGRAQDRAARARRASAVVVASIPSTRRASGDSVDRLRRARVRPRRRARAPPGRSRPTTTSAGRTGAGARRSSRPDRDRGRRTRGGGRTRRAASRAATAAGRCRTRRPTCRRCRRR